ncbi:MAG: ArsA family ATPase [Chloroflexi bacterium]|nr:MAG: ArsA family ATPase [Chloroflexota bacterium]
MRIIVHTGKGGVGKTSISAATALRCAEMGLKTIVISTDSAHSLADSLDKQLGPEATEICPNLWAQEIDVRYSMEQYWGRFQKQMAAMFSGRGVDDIVAEEVTVLPGLEEGAHLLWVNKYHNEGDFDVLIVDAAPTAETLRLLSLPEATRWWFNKTVRFMKGASKIMRPIGKMFNRADIPDGAAWDQVYQLFETLDNVRQLLSDPAHSSIRLVVNPEKMVIKETQRTYTYLNLYGYATDAIIANRIIPPEVTDPYFAQWKADQQSNLAYIQEAFGELPVLRAPLFSQEMGGLEALNMLADSLYGERNPAERLFDGRTHTIESDGAGGYLLTVPLPFTEKHELDVFRSRDELTLKVGSYRRNIVLPFALWDLAIDDARFEQSSLRIRFSGETKAVEVEPAPDEN